MGRHQAISFVKNNIIGLVLSEHDGEHVDPDDSKIRVSCGVSFGLLLGTLICLLSLPEHWATWIVVAVGGGASCGYLALRFGDQFWYRVSEFLNWLRWL
jgi:hypothetical protein